MLRTPIRRVVLTCPARNLLRARLLHSTAPQDPFPLPLSEKLAHLVDAPEDVEGLPPRPAPRPNEDVRTLRARLTYQSRKRGTLECDLLLSTFASENLASMSEGELREYDQLLDEPEWTIYYWAIGKREPPPRWAESDILKRLQEHSKNEARVVRRMPDLKPPLDE
ncbi:Flavinator of succinate dehydrogenase-domain-containing protein [Auriculariales sp. MPI-PUGE-AT-0066]|nr:Flavinator of succinate dehydrogenase-domain-containing protein [Auriculariales sp. MPI-PUGE-AT-0066]